MLRSGFLGISDEDLEAEDGVVSADGHIHLTLADDVDEARLSAIFEGDSDEVSTENETMDQEDN